MRISDWSSDVCSSDLMLADLCDIDLRISQGAPAQAVLAAADAIGLDRLADMMADESPQYRPVAVAASLCRIKLRLLAGERDAALEELARLRGWADQRRSEEHTSELQSLMRISYAVFCLKKKKK